MSNIKIILDSCSSIPKNLIDEFQIKVIPTNFFLDGVSYNPLEKNFESDEFYEKLKNAKEILTSQINPFIFKEAFDEELKKGNDILYFSLSSALSGSFKNALTSKEDSQNIEIIDSKSASAGIILEVKKAIELIKEGKNIHEIKDEIIKYQKEIKAYFKVGSLYHLYKGGRLKKTSLALGNILRIKPILKCNELGALELLENKIGNKNALIKLFNIYKEMRTYNEIYIGYTNNLDELNYFKELILNFDSSTKIEELELDYTLACHSGPNTLAIFFK